MTTSEQKKDDGSVTCRCLQCVPRSACASSPLTEELKEFIDRAIVPALERNYLAIAEAEIDLAPNESDAAHSEAARYQS